LDNQGNWYFLDSDFSIIINDYNSILGIDEPKRYPTLKTYNGDIPIKEIVVDTSLGKDVTVALNKGKYVYLYNLLDSFVMKKFEIYTPYVDSKCISLKDQKIDLLGR